MSTQKNKMGSKVSALVECAIMIALSTILSLIKLYELPYGGAVTAASMLPIIIVAYRHGTAVGLGAGLVYAVLQQLFGLNTLSYATSWKAVVAIIFLDYVLAFVVAGLGGVFRKKGRRASNALLWGGILACLLRYLCHTIAGATVWAGISIPTKAALIYSISYNATYMLPETVVLSVAIIYVASVINFETQIPTRVKSGSDDILARLMPLVGGLLLAGVAIFDSVKILPALQNPDSGEFDITRLATLDYTSVIIVTAAAVVLASFCFIISAVRNKKLSS